MSNHGLSNPQLKILQRILSPFAAKIETVGLFGSRATGLYKENSDIDLVIYGSLSAEDEQRLWTLLDESNLSLPVDIIVYQNTPFDTVMVPLFSKKELTDNFKN
jgi:predicted nucleotidyltransferase